MSSVMVPRQENFPRREEMDHPLPNHDSAPFPVHLRMAHLPVNRDMVDIVQAAFDEVGLINATPLAKGLAQSGNPCLRAPLPEPYHYQGEDDLPDLGTHDCCVCYERIYDLLPCNYPLCTPARSPHSDWWVCPGCGAHMRDSYIWCTHHRGHYLTNR